MTRPTIGRHLARGAPRLSFAEARRWPRRRALLAVTLLCGTLAGCAAGQVTQTASQTPETAGVGGTAGSMVLDDVFLETADTVPAGGTVALRAAFTDQSPQPDRLVAVTTPVAASVELLQPDGAVATDGIEIPGEGQVDATTGPALVRLNGLTRALSTQTLAPITFEFERAGRVTLDDVPAATPAQGQR
ncbi:MAG TPA: copper chaperone PCu(A)C [Modestobacter sp.]|nr:copper chaperone PCu(A)C [Modestobacter sp.]